eukprot:69474-Rhodomonas_salina.2
MPDTPSASSRSKPSPFLPVRGPSLPSCTHSLTTSTYLLALSLRLLSYSDSLNLLRTLTQLPVSTVSLAGRTHSLPAGTLSPSYTHSCTLSQPSLTPYEQQRTSRPYWRFLNTLCEPMRIASGFRAPATLLRPAQY